ncbi:ABC transporter permease [Streptomyces natalensis]|uniref:ABC transporter permease n=1 Tax=Streptomyces natalensis TaxID=68242 RepID=UPI0006993E9B|nr:ABC transporter permease [Streptomyces natalensis]
MRGPGRPLATAVWFALLSHARNRLAVGLAVFFLPLFVFVTGTAAPSSALPLALGETVGPASAAADRVMRVACALNAVILLTGLMMFMATIRADALDRRLVLAGYPRVHLLLGKTLALCAVSCLFALYTTALLTVFFPVRQPWTLACAVATACLAYGGIGIFLGALVRSELAGVFTVIMASMIDMGLHNPAASQLGDAPGLRLLPMHGPTRAALTSAFTTGSLPGGLLAGLAWFAAATLAAFTVFHTRTRYGRPEQLRPGTQPEESTSHR